jgi:hypothetical protein
MTEPITPKQLGILQFIFKNPNVNKTQIISSTGAADADLAYLEQHDMIREREIGCFRVAHFGEMVLRRSL